MIPRGYRVPIIVKTLHKVLVDCRGLCLCLGAFGFGFGFLALEKGLFRRGAELGGYVREIVGRHLDTPSISMFLHYRSLGNYSGWFKGPKVGESLDSPRRAERQEQVRKTAEAGVSNFQQSEYALSSFDG
jgi:hypothetical protein